MKTVKEIIRGIKVRLKSMKGSPEKIALGYALGIFLTTTPLVGLKVPIALGICQLFKWKKTAAVIGVFHVNTLTGPFYYGLSFLLGKSVMGYHCSFEVPAGFGFRAMAAFFNSGSEVFISLWVGGLIIGVPLSLLAYKLVMSLLKKHRHTLAHPGGTQSV